MDWIYLSKNGTDEYVNRLAKSAGVMPVPESDWQYENNLSSGIVLRGIMKHKIMKRCWTEGRRFRYMDTGYFGNRVGPGNQHGWKVWHRIVDNDLQHQTVIDRPSDRWDRLNILPKPFLKRGREILVVAPDDKPCVFYGTTLQKWIDDTVALLEKHTDRPIVVRHRQSGMIKHNRNADTSFDAALNTAWAVVTFNSNAGTESILNGVPVFVTQAANAARPVSSNDLSKIETPYYPNDDEVRRWASHLAYGQFHNRELEDGTALRILKETEEILDL